LASFNTEKKSFEMIHIVLIAWYRDIRAMFVLPLKYDLYRDRNMSIIIIIIIIIQKI